MAVETPNQSEVENLEDLYQLSPMQLGMLFHTLEAPESGVYFEQSVFTIEGPLDASSFERAWQAVINRHSILRSAFLWQNLDSPVQVVHRLPAKLRARNVPLPEDAADVRSIPRRKKAR